MITHKLARIGAFVATVGAAAALAGTAVHATGAYFSDSKAGTISGTLGSIKVTTTGGAAVDQPDFQFTNMLPGTPQTASVSYSNSGTSPEDVYLVFNNADALHALNNLGRYGEVHVTSDGTEIFASQNLNDNTVSCPPGAGPAPVCAALPQEIKLADNLNPGSGRAFTFAFNFAARLKGATAEGGTFNCYPVGSCTSSGLPYKVVATQHGVDPFDTNNTSTP